MPLTLTNDKTWQLDVNNVIATAGSDDLTNAALMAAIVSAFTGFALNPPTIKAASNGAGSVGTTFGAIWATAGSNHGWVVLDFGTAELCIDLASATSTNTHLATFVFSPSAGFSGGTATTRPTATDEQVLISSAAWGGKNGADEQHVFHSWLSSDGNCARLAIYRANVCVGLMILDTPKNQVSGWTTPAVCGWLGNAAATPQNTAALWHSAATLKGRVTGTAASFYMTGEAANGVLVGQSWGSANSLTSEWPVGNIGLFTLATAKEGRHGEVNDLWWVSSGLADADTMDVDDDGDTPANDRDYVVIGDFLFPWTGDSTVMQTS